MAGIESGFARGQGERRLPDSDDRTSDYLIRRTARHALRRADEGPVHRGGPARAPDAIGRPGEYPFTRGVYPSRCTAGRLWTMRQFAGFGTARRPTSASTTCSTTARRGSRPPSTCRSLMGHDSDHARSRSARSAARASPSTRSTTWRRCSTASTSARSRVSMTINAPGGDHARLLRRRRPRSTGVAARAARRHDPGRHPQGVHRPEGVVLPDRPGDAPARRHDRVVHARTCRAGTRSRSPATTSARPARPPRRSSRSRSRTASPTSSRRSSAASTSTTSRRGCRFFFNAQIDFFEEIAKYRAARRIWARELRDTYGAKNERSLADALPHADRRRLADRAAAAEQHRPHDDRGARRRARRHPVAAHQLLRRGARAADRGGGADRAAHAADHRPRDRRRQHRRPARRLLLRRGADRRDGGAGLRLLPPHRRARRHGRGGQAATTPSARSPTPRSSCSTRSTTASGSSSASTATSHDDETPMPILRIDPALERKQIDRLQAARARRDGAAVEAALADAARATPRSRAQPDAPAARVRPRARDRGRDGRGAAGGLGRLHRDARSSSARPRAPITVRQLARGESGRRQRGTPG